MIPIYYIATPDVDSAVSGRVAGWVSRFCQIVAQPPLGLKLEPRPATGETGAAIMACLRESCIASASAEITERMVDGRAGPVPRVLVVCGAASDVAQKVRTNNPNAVWGGSLGAVAIVCRHEPEVVWHELLHTLGAKDCYDEDAPDAEATPTCGDRRCIMQYAPTLGRVGDPPFLCETNARRIQVRMNHGKDAE